MVCACHLVVRQVNTALVCACHLVVRQVNTTIEILERLKGQVCQLFPLHSFPNVSTQSTTYFLSLCSYLSSYSIPFRANCKLSISGSQSVSWHYFVTAFPEPGSLSKIGFYFTCVRKQHVVWAGYHSPTGSILATIIKVLVNTSVTDVTD